LRSDSADNVREGSVRTIPEASEVRSQLANVLASAQFRNSKRSQSLLRYVVDAAVEGRHDVLKERTIGTTVFGREASYDTSQDAIVRNAAVEVRKRLAQYYLEPDHRGELRIELPLGSYVPAFPNDSDLAPTPSAPSLVPVPIPAPAEAAAPRRRKLLLLVAGGFLLAIAGILTVWLTHRTAATELEAFWAPLFQRHEVVQVCIGQPGRLYRFAGPRRDQLDHAIQGRGSAPDPNPTTLSIAPTELEWIAPDFLYMRDAFAAARVAAWVQSNGSPYRLMSVSRATYSQLRRSPLVAIGGFDNAWAMRVTSELRYIFDHKTINGEVYNCIIDRRKPEATDWKVARSVGFATTQDFAIVTRVFDPTTERTVLSVAGIENYGTLAAGEFVTEPDYLGAALLQVPRDWRRRNVQIVLGTKIIEGTPGPPQVLASYYW
jgi:hypothetical protein